MKFLLVFHFLVTLTLVGVILIQKSGDSAMGIGGNSGGMGGLLSPRGQANLLTRITSVLAVVFMLNCLLMAMISKPERKNVSVVDRAAQEQIIDVPNGSSISHAIEQKPSRRPTNRPGIVPHKPK